MATHEAIRAKRVQHAQRALHAAMATINNASQAAMEAAATLDRQSAACRADWMDAT